MSDYFSTAKTVFDIEKETINQLYINLASHFDSACEQLLQTQGKVIVMGMGKSGHIANKIAATLASTGTPAFSVNAAEASHGDFGMIEPKDTVIAISNSGSTPEIVSLLPLFEKLGIPLISITGNPDSPLALASQTHLWVEVQQEACPLNLAPTASTTAALVLGDALAVALLKAKNFSQNDFAFSHPGGNLGKRLLLTVKALMKSENNIPRVSSEASLQSALFEITQKKLGMTTVIDQNQKTIGLFTDGDLRRLFEKYNEDFNALNNIMIKDVMTENPKSISQNTLASKALEIMEQYKITSLLVTPPNQPQNCIGIVHLHHILESGII